MIKIICAYCQKYMGEKDGQGVTGFSHGICECCMEEQYKEIKIMALKKLMVTI